MKSRAHVKGHPIHPALIPFPFAFLMGALLFDLLAVVRNTTTFGLTGGYLAIAGVAAGLLAAVPGIVDYLYSVPPQSSARRRATTHALCNVAVLALFVVAFVLRRDTWQPTAGTIGLELVGAGALAYAGWLGGTLVSRNMISVDHRYAQAGRWQEAWLTSHDRDPLVVGHVDDLKDNQMKLLHVNGTRLVLARTSDGYRVFEDRCTHRGGSLADGVLICGIVQCLWHGSQFDVTTGRVTCGPAKTPIRAFEVQQKKNGQIVLVSPPG